MNQHNFFAELKRRNAELLSLDWKNTFGGSKRVKAAASGLRAFVEGREV